MPNPAQPTKQDEAYFVEQLQLIELRGINSALYSNGSSIPADRRRDLSKRLDRLLGVIEQQTFKVLEA